MQTTFINWLQATEKFEIEGRGTLYVGSAPFGFDKRKSEDMDRF